MDGFPVIFLALPYFLTIRKNIKVLIFYKMFDEMSNPNHLINYPTKP
jgi:hypothetical protein